MSPITDVYKRQTKDWRKSLYYHYYEYPAEHAVRKHFGIRTDRYKLCHIDRWEKRGISEDLVALSYEKTISKIGKPQIAYMAKILDGWLEKDLKTPEEVEAYFKNPENRLLNGTSGNASKSERLDFDLDDIFERP